MKKLTKKTFFYHKAIFLFMISCSSDDTQNQNRWDLADENNINSNRADLSLDIDSKEDCLHEEDIFVLTQRDVDKLSEFKCSNLIGNIFIIIDDDTTEIKSLGSMKYIEGNIVFGSNEFEEQSNLNLNSIEGFKSIEEVENIYIYDAARLSSLDAFLSIKKVGDIRVLNDPTYKNFLGFRCEDVEKLRRELGSAIYGNVYCEFF